MSELLSKYGIDQSKMVFVTVELACDVEVKKQARNFSFFSQHDIVSDNSEFCQIILSFISFFLSLITSCLLDRSYEIEVSLVKSG